LKEKYFVAFLDILGFRNVVMDDKSEEKVQKVLKSLKNAIDKTELHAGFKHIIFSDSLLIYIKDEYDCVQSFKPLRDICFVVQQIQFECMKDNVWFRGGISHGEMIETSVGEYKNIYGKALIDAYQHEQQAKYPRVVLSPSVIKAVGSYSRQTFFSSLLEHSNNKYNKSLVFDWNKYSDLFISEDCLTYIDYLGVSDFAALRKCTSYVRKNLLLNNASVFENFIWIKLYLKTVAPCVKMDSTDSKNLLSVLSDIESL